MTLEEMGVQEHAELDEVDDGANILRSCDV
jgi:hypothetical protein